MTILSMTPWKMENGIKNITEVILQNRTLVQVCQRLLKESHDQVESRSGCDTWRLSCSTTGDAEGYTLDADP